MRGVCVWGGERGSCIRNEVQIGGPGALRLASAHLCRSHGAKSTDTHTHTQRERERERERALLGNNEGGREGERERERRRRRFY